jgi:thioredoxin-like negative regulator of GroEL
MADFEKEFMGKPVDLIDANFEKIFQRWAVAMIDFWTVNCQPCSVIAPWMEEFAEKYAGKVFVGKIRADENPKAVSYFNVTTAPTILIMKQGREVDRITLQTIDKSHPKENIEERLILHLK